MVGGVGWSSSEPCGHVVPTLSQDPSNTQHFSNFSYSAKRRMQRALIICKPNTCENGNIPEVTERPLLFPFHFLPLAAREGGCLHAALMPTPAGRAAPRPWTGRESARAKPQQAPKQCVPDPHPCALWLIFKPLQRSQEPRRQHAVPVPSLLPPSLFFVERNSRRFSVPSLEGHPTWGRQDGIKGLGGPSSDAQPPRTPPRPPYL